MWICVGPCDPATKPSRGRLVIAKTKAAARFCSWNYRGTEVIDENPNQDSGCDLVLNLNQEPAWFRFSHGATMNQNLNQNHYRQAARTRNPNSWRSARFQDSDEYSVA